ncbi:MAG TPA: glycosyltransferase [Solirubrobacteraceae bacterium]|nr:glycosyltransferase [Solirubrobacteraceae bacterium]
MIEGARRRPRLVSVVVPVRDAAEHLPCQLDALAGQDHTGPWEVVIADNGSRDGSLEVARRWMSRLPSPQLVRATAVRGPSHARNAGAAVARGDFLAFCDADDVASPSWVRRMADAARDGDLVAGGVGAGEINDDLTRSWHGVTPRDRALRGMRFLVHASGTSTGVWAEAFDALGGFDEDVPAGEDIEFSWRAQLAGYRLAEAPEAVVHERYRRRIRDLASQHVRYGAAGPLLYRRFRRAGMPPSPPGRALLGWASIAGRVPTVVWSGRTRGRWTIEAALRLGQLTGSLRHRVLYL